MVKYILILLLLINSYCIQITELNDSNFDELVNNGISKNWLVMFYLEKCPHCVNAKDVISKLIKKDNFKKTSVGMVECTQNVFSCMRFNITRVPYIVLLENNNMFEFNTYATEQSLSKFITEEKNVENVMKIPNKIGYLEFFFKLMGEGVNLINDYLKDYANHNLKIDIEWNMFHTMGIFVISLVLVIFIEYLILSICYKNCKKKEKKDKEVHQKTE